MGRKILNILVGLLLLGETVFAAMGDWRSYLAYSEVQEIEQAGKLIFVQASNNLYVYNQDDQSIQTFSKTDFLSDCGIRHIAYCQAARRLFILYGNNNIDLMDIGDYEVTALPDYYHATILGDKMVNDIFIQGNEAYLSTGFGIVKINMKDAAVSDTYQLGFKVDWCETDGSHIYAYSQQEGKYQASLKSNLLDRKNWIRTGDYVAKPQQDKQALRDLVSTLAPGGPKYNYFWNMKFTHGRLYTCGGSFLSGMPDMMRPGTIQVLKDNEWTVFQDQLETVTGYEYRSVNCVEPDYNEPDHVYASGKTGLYEFSNGRLVNYYNKDNSPLEGAYDRGNILGNDYVLVHSLYADRDGSLWLLNSQAVHNSILCLKDGVFTSHPQPSLMEEHCSMAGMVALMKDSRGLLWFTNNNYSEPAIVSYNTTGDAVSVIKKPLYNQDGVTLNPYHIRCIAEDREGNMWVGTDQGPFYLSSEAISGNDATLTQVKVPRNDGTNYADYLLAGIDITCMAIDGGNQKWFGTNGNGVYLISSDNFSQIAHFTAEDSPLFSNNIESIAVNPQTGEVFFGTDRGLCSYMNGVSTPAGSMEKESVWAYPNPVSPDYSGYITITGLSYDADVKIVASSGALVNQGRSTGGIYQWDGRDLRGRKVAAGVYLAAIAYHDGSKGTVCKIAIVR